MSLTRISKNFVRNTALGVASLVPAMKRIAEKSCEDIVDEKHQYHESIQLLNAMRRTGGVRTIKAGTNDNGVPVGQLSERVMRHVNLDSLNSRIASGYDEVGYADSVDPVPGSDWGTFGQVVPEVEPRIPRPKPSTAEAMQAYNNLNKPTNVKTLQEELFG